MWRSSRRRRRRKIRPIFETFWYWKSFWLQMNYHIKTNIHKKFKLTQSQLNIVSLALIVTYLECLSAFISSYTLHLCFASTVIFFRIKLFINKTFFYLSCFLHTGQFIETCVQYCRIAVFLPISADFPSKEQFCIFFSFHLPPNVETSVQLMRVCNSWISVFSFDQ